MRTVKAFAAILSFIILSFALLCSCSGGASADFTIDVRSAGGAPLSDIEIRVYTDDKDKTLVWAAETDSDGRITFTATTGKEYVAFIENAPVGYDTDDRYEISEETTEIVLETRLLTEKEAKETKIKLGSSFFDFTVMDVDGNTHKLSQLLETKKAVVLNFWFINCGPCRTEFPYLADAYKDYSDSIEVIAINPVDGTQTTVKNYALDNNLPFPCAVGNSIFTETLGLTGYPTTIVIDRYGTVAMMHMGAITNKEDFTTIFEYFTSDSYTQTTVRNVEDIKSN